MRPARATALAAASVLLLLTVAAMASAQSGSLTVAVTKPTRAYVGDAYNGAIAVGGSGGTDVQLEIVTEPALVSPTLVLPAGVTCESASSTKWVCDLGDLAAREVKVITVKGVVSPAAGGDAAAGVFEGTQTLTGTATYTEGAAPVVVSGSTKVTPRADFSISFETTSLELERLTMHDVRLFVTNAGPSPMSGEVRITYPGYMYNVGGSDCNYESESMRSCPVGLLAPGGSQEIWIQILPFYESSGDSVLEAIIFPPGAAAGASRVYHSVIDRSLFNNGDYIDIHITGADDSGPIGGEGEDWLSGGDNDGGAEGGSGNGEQQNTPQEKPVPDVAGTLSGPASIMSTDDGEFRFALSNTGTGPSGNLRATFALTGNGEFTGVSPHRGCSVTATTVTCNYGALAKDANVATVLTVIAGDVGSLTVTPTLSEGTVPSAVTTTVTAPQTDLEFTQLSASDESAAMGEDVTVTFAVKNNGPASVADAYVETAMPDGLEMGTDSRGPCVTIGRTIRCYLGTILAGETQSVDVTVQAEMAGSYTANAVVASSVTDTVSTNNARSLTVTVSPA